MDQAETRSVVIRRASERDTDLDPQQDPGFNHSQRSPMLTHPPCPALHLRPFGPLPGLVLFLPPEATIRAARPWPHHVALAALARPVRLAKVRAEGGAAAVWVAPARERRPRGRRDRFLRLAGWRHFAPDRSSLLSLGNLAGSHNLVLGIHLHRLRRRRRLGPARERHPHLAVGERDTVRVGIFGRLARTLARAERRGLRERRRQEIDGRRTRRAVAPRLAHASAGRAAALPVPLLPHLVLIALAQQCLVLGVPVARSAGLVVVTIAHRLGRQPCVRVPARPLLLLAHVGEQPRVRLGRHLHHHLEPEPLDQPLHQVAHLASSGGTSRGSSGSTASRGSAASCTLSKTTAARTTSCSRWRSSGSTVSKSRMPAGVIAGEARCSYSSRESASSDAATMCGVLPASPAATETTTDDRASARLASGATACARSAMSSSASKAAARDLTFDSLVANTTSPSMRPSAACNWSAESRVAMAWRQRSRRRLQAVWQAGSASSSAALISSSRWLKKEGWCSTRVERAL
eukprot:scaffold2753_cov115-Isochrysis_galbana.AAC.1